MTLRKFALIALLGTTSTAVVTQPAAAQSSATHEISFNIPSGDLVPALRKFARQSRMEVIFSAADLRGHRTAGAIGRLSPAAALDRLVAGSGAELVRDASGAYLVRVPGQRGAAGLGSSQAMPAGIGAETSASSGEGSPVAGEVTRESIEREIASAGVTEILVTGRKTLNVDVRRSEDDAQPYVVVTRENLLQSGASTISQYLRDSLPMNSQPYIASQSLSGENTSLVNLRSLGSNQTLILIDGRRAPRYRSDGSPSQADINSIPIGAVERIEVLPTTASGIYGGSATGGVINVVLRRDYRGIEFGVMYGNTDRLDRGRYRFDLTFGTSFDEGRTSLIGTVSRSHEGVIRQGDRDFVTRQRQLLQRNNPAAIYDDFFAPLGAAANFKSADGSSLYGPGTPSYGTVPLAYAGGGSVNTLVPFAGIYNLDLADTSQSNGGALATLSQGSTVTSGRISVRSSIGSRFEVYSELSRSRSEGSSYGSSVFGGFFVDAIAPNNPFGQLVYVTAPLPGADDHYQTRNDDISLLGGIIFRPTSKWAISAEGSWYQNDLRRGDQRGLDFSLYSDIQNGAIDVFRGSGLTRADLAPYLFTQSSDVFRTRTQNMNLRASGELIRLPAGSLNLTALAEYRKEAFLESRTNAGPYGVIVSPNKTQSVRSLYGELTIPLAADTKTLPFARELIIQLAGRLDKYEIHGATTSTDPSEPPVRNTNRFTSINPTLSLKWSPARDLTLRASYARGFLPPSVDQVVTVPYTFIASVRDPKRGNEIVNLAPGQYLTGGNPDLSPERSRTISIGAILTPHFAPTLRLSVDYSWLRKRDIIASLSDTALIDNEALFPGRVVRDPDDLADEFLVGRITTFNSSSVNIATLGTEALDFQVDYSRELGVGKIGFSGIGTYQPTFRTRLLPQSPQIENVAKSSPSGTFGIPSRFRGVATLTYSRPSFEAALTARYFSSYQLDSSGSGGVPAYDYELSNGGRPVRAQTYFDLALTKDLSLSSARVIPRVYATVRNLFDKTPPFDPLAGSGTGGGYSYFGDPAGRTFEIGIRASF